MKTVTDVPSTSKDLQPCVQYPWDAQDTDDEDNSSSESEEEKEESAEEEVKNYEEEKSQQEENKNESSSSSEESSSEEEEESTPQKYSWQSRNFRSPIYLSSPSPTSNEAASSSRSPEVSLRKFLSLTGLKCFTIDIVFIIIL